MSFLEFHNSKKLCMTKITYQEIHKNKTFRDYKTDFKSYDPSFTRQPVLYNSLNRDVGVFCWLVSFPQQGSEALIVSVLHFHHCEYKVTPAIHSFQKNAREFLSLWETSFKSSVVYLERDLQEAVQREVSQILMGMK